MRCFSTLLAALSVFGGVLLGTEWKALVTSASDEAGAVIPIGTSSYEQGSPISVEEAPAAIAITPDGRTALVANHDSDTISVIDIAAGSTSTIDLPSETYPENIAITPDGKKAVVVGRPAAYSYCALVLDLTTNQIETNPFSLLFGTSLAITPDGKWALVGASDSLGSISILDLTTTPASFKANIIPGLFEGEVAVTPDGSRAIALTSGLNTATMIDLTAQPDPVQVHTVTVGPNPIEIAITPDGKRALVLFAGSTDIDGGISVLDLTTTPMSVQTLSVPFSGYESYAPTDIAITPDGKKAVATIQLLVGEPAYSYVLFYDLTTDPISRISTSEVAIEAATSVAITPDQAPTAHFTSTKHGKKVVFDASGSTSPIGSIERYRWKFGDHHKKTTASPVVTHKYGEEFCGKDLHVQLKVTNTAGTSTKVTFTGKTVSNNGGLSAVCKHHLKLSSRCRAKDPLVTCARNGFKVRPVGQ